MQSENINELVEALAKAQAEIKGAVKDMTAGKDVKFTYKYADLASVWDACRKPLTINDLAIAQITEIEDGKLYLDTMLMHKSGQWLKGRLPVEPVQRTPQGIGSALTYAKRYGLSSMVGVAPEDDDGEAASRGAHNGAGAKANGAGKRRPPGNTVIDPDTGEILDQSPLTPDSPPHPAKTWCQNARVAILETETIEAKQVWWTTHQTDIDALPEEFRVGLLKVWEAHMPPRAKPHAGAPPISPEDALAGG